MGKTPILLYSLANTMEKDMKYVPCFVGMNQMNTVEMDRNYVPCFVGTNTQLG